MDGDDDLGGREAKVQPAFDPRETWLEALDGPLGEDLAVLWDALDDLVMHEGPAGLLRLLAEAEHAVADPPTLRSLPLFALTDPLARAAFGIDLAELDELVSGNAGLTPLGGPMAVVHAALRGGERQRCAALVTFASAAELHAIDQHDVYDPVGRASHGDEAQAAGDGLTDMEWRYGAGGAPGAEMLVTVGVAPGGTPALLVLAHDPNGPPGFDPLFAAARDEALRIAAVLLDELA